MYSRPVLSQMLTHPQGQGSVKPSNGFVKAGYYSFQRPGIAMNITILPKLEPGYYQSLLLLKVIIDVDHLQAALDRVQTFCTTVVVAHRLSTIRNADSIAVLQEGKILEQGSHSTLMQRPKGAYRALINQQQQALWEFAYFHLIPF